MQPTDRTDPRHPYYGQVEAKPLFPLRPGHLYCILLINDQTDTIRILESTEKYIKGSSEPEDHLVFIGWQYVVSAMEVTQE
jgi:hypothetical protein